MFDVIKKIFTSDRDRSNKLEIIYRENRVVTVTNVYLGSVTGIINKTKIPTAMYNPDTQLVKVQEKLVRKAIRNWFAMNLNGIPVIRKEKVNKETGEVDYSDPIGKATNLRVSDHSLYCDITIDCSLLGENFGIVAKGANNDIAPFYSACILRFRDEINPYTGELSITNLAITGVMIGFYA